MHAVNSQLYIEGAMDVLFFHVPYTAKRLLNDSISRDRSGCSSIQSGSALSGCGDILLSRVESVAAIALAASSGLVFVLSSIIITPCFLIPAAILNLASRLPYISSFKLVQDFKEESSSLIYRTLKVNLIAIPVIFLFVTASSINTFLPRLLDSQNIFFRSINHLVESYGPLKRIHVTVPGEGSYTGSERERLSILEIAEDDLRSFSSQNYLREKVVDVLTIHWTSFVRR